MTKLLMAMTNKYIMYHQYLDMLDSDMTDARNFLK
jgi:hypothetical protein